MSFVTSERRTLVMKRPSTISKHAKAALWLPMALAVSAAAQAEIHFNGFASVGGGWIDSDKKDSTYLGYGEEPTFDPDTVFALQASADIDEKMSVTGQVVARGTDNYQAEFSWAYFSYKVQDDLTVRLGRFRTPFYLYSDYLEVGYAYHWIRPPVEAYSIPFDSVSGVDVVYQTAFGYWDNTLQFYYGGLNDEYYQNELKTDLNVETRHQTGLAWTLSRDWFTFRMAYHRANITIDQFDDAINKQLVAAGLTSAVAGAVTAPMAIDETLFEFYQVGFRIDWESYLLAAESTRFEPQDGPASRWDRWYVTAGYRISDEVMVHTTYAKAEDNAANMASRYSSPTLAAIAASALSNLADDKESMGLGVRYDFRPGAALKVEWTHVDDHRAGAADADLYAFVVDVVF
ncbi:MAG: porin [Hahellaceae bacterium]|nr:porin [Hahellaceae bacterium]